MSPGTAQRFSAEASERAKAHAETMARLHYEAWQHVAASRRLIWPSVRGGSAGDSLNEKIRGALLTGALPRVDVKVWAGKGTGTRTCACCAQPIAAGDVEYEPPRARGLHAHLRCFTA